MCRRSSPPRVSSASLLATCCWYSRSAPPSRSRWPRCSRRASVSFLSCCCMRFTASKPEATEARSLRSRSNKRAVSFLSEFLWRLRAVSSFAWRFTTSACFSTVCLSASICLVRSLCVFCLKWSSCLLSSLCALPSHVTVLSSFFCLSSSGFVAVPAMSCIIFVRFVVSCFPKRSVCLCWFLSSPWLIFSSSFSMDLEIHALTFLVSCFLFVSFSFETSAQVLRHASKPC
mmetsp:Transcript_22479/g.43752  ORF Transcript_22479/g.43752 Transcript_22479/m.43752 type:complete len:230 (+) Transcript_22479:990-1679(+)